MRLHMAKVPPTRLFVVLLREVCASMGIKMRAHHGDWLLTLRQGTRTEHVFGYDFSLNSAAAQQIARDKSATYSVLADARVPAVEHHLIMSPTLPDYMPSGGNWARLLELFEQWGRDLVAKPNEGTAGREVLRLRNQMELERGIHQLLGKARACAVSPFLAIRDEYRVLMLDGEALLVYRKLRAAVTGDGRRRVTELLAEWLESGGAGGAVAEAKLKALGKMELTAAELDRVPVPGELVAINWRHNLGQGAVAEELTGEVPERVQLVKLATKAMAALRLRVASVDIVVTAHGRRRILEVNSGIMMEHFGLVERARATAIYRRIIEAVFAKN